jgi:hypothetical protein
VIQVLLLELPFLFQCLLAQHLSDSIHSHTPPVRAHTGTQAKQSVLKVWISEQSTCYDYKLQMMLQCASNRSCTALCNTVKGVVTVKLQCERMQRVRLLYQVHAD